MVKKKKFTGFALFWFLLAAVIGTWIRAMFFTGTFGLIPGNVLHAHSHIAFQGWVFSAFFVGICTFFEDEALKKGKYRLQFVVFQMLFPCILVSFLLQGYAFWSILFSSLFQLFSYWFVVRTLLDLAVSPRFSSKMMSWAVLLYFLSTFGPWALAVIGAKGLMATPWYDRAIYFFLHFQYNGAFFIAVLALWCRIAEENGHELAKGMKTGAKLFLLSVFPGYFLNLLGEESVPAWVKATGGAAALLQLLAVFFFAGSFFKEKLAAVLRRQNPWAALLIFSSLIFLTVKTLLLSASALPVFRELFFHTHNLVIAYLHLSLIGFISLGLIGFFAHKKLIRTEDIWSKAGITMLLAGFIVTEAVLAAAGFSLFVPMTHWILFTGSLAMVVGIGSMLLGQVGED